MKKQKLELAWIGKENRPEEKRGREPFLCLKREDLDEFVKCYDPGNRYQREPTWSEKNPDGRWRAYDYEELINRDKVSLDIFWLRDESLEEYDNLPNPEVLAQEIVDDLEAALEQFREITMDLGGQKIFNSSPDLRASDS